MFIFRSPANQVTGSAPDRERAGSERLTPGRCQCTSQHDGVSDISRRVSSHRTLHGHVVYYRCDCGVTHMAMLRWSTEPSSGATRLR